MIEYVAIALLLGLGVAAGAWLGERHARARAAEERAPEADLRASRERLERAYRVGRLGSFGADVASGAMQWSDALYELMEIEPDVAPTTDLALALVHPRDRDVVAHAVEEMRAGKDGLDVTARFMRSSGRVLWLHAVAELQRDAQGRATHVIGVAQDVTPLMEAVDRLRKSETLLGRAQRVGRLGGWTRGVDEQVGIVSPELYQLFGLDPDLFVPTSTAMIELVDAAYRAEIAQALQALVSTGLPIDRTVRATRADGSGFWMRMVAELMPDEAGDGKVIVGIAQDVTERHEAYERLRVSEQAYRLLFERVPMPIWIYALDDKRILAVNDAAVDHYGYARDEFLGMSIDMLRTVEDREDVAGLDGDRDSGLLSAGLWRHARKDRSVIEVEITSHSLQWEGRAARMVLAKDVTAQLRAQREVRERELQLRQILADASDGLLVIGADGVVRFANPAVGPMLGRTPEQLEDRFVPRELDIVDDGGAEVAVGAGERRVLDVKVGNTVWDGENARILALRDVTESRRAGERLRMLERAIQSTNNGVVIADARQPDLPIIYVNRAFETVTGWPQAAVLGRNCRLLQGDDRDQAELGQVRDALRARRDCEVVVRNYRRDGSLFWNHLSIAPVRDERGEVTHYVGVINDLTDRRRYEAELAYLANHDPVTGLPRFSVLEEYLKAQLPDAQRTGSRVAVFYVDLDRFHTVNETMGHTVGDQALRLLGERLRAQVGDAGRVARVAGDEFVAVLTCRRGEVDPLEFADQMRRRVELPLEILPYKLYLTCSIGISVFPDNASGVRELLHCADAAVTRVKATGRNSVMAFSNDQSDALRDRLALGGRLRAAIENNEMVLHYQPQVSAHNGRLVGLEALVRWQTEDLGLLPPARFIRVAEELGLIVDLGRWVLESACRQARHWYDLGYDDIVIAVNVSALQFQRPSFLSEVSEALRESDLPPRMLELELTESAIMENVERMVDTMGALKRLGVRLALDDFGIGYSSLNYLKRFPIDKLKIDQSFVADVTRDRGDAAIARSIIAIGHQLGMTVLAEGVETQAQLGYLRRNHCDEFQGMFFGMPVACAEAEAILQRRWLSADAFAATRPEQTLLLLDDEENILRALVRLLRRDGYRILVATNAAQAFEILGREDVHVIVSDQRMPDISGTEFLSRVKEMYPDTVRLVLSGYTDLASVTDAINRGAIYKFLTKPWDDEDLRRQIHEAFRTHDDRRGAAVAEGV